MPRPARTVPPGIQRALRETAATPYLRATGRRRPILPLRVPGKAAAAFRDGANLAPDRAVGRRTWEEFLHERVNARAADPAPA